MRESLPLLLALITILSVHISIPQYISEIVPCAGPEKTRRRDARTKAKRRWMLFSPILGWFGNISFCV
jgi:hypothetical protein